MEEREKKERKKRDPVLCTCERNSEQKTRKKRKKIMSKDGAAVDRESNPQIALAPFSERFEHVTADRPIFWCEEALCIRSIHVNTLNEACTRGYRYVIFTIC